MSLKKTELAMGKDYVLFLHGVNVREPKENERKQNYTCADKLFNLIVKLVRQKDRNKLPPSDKRFWLWQMAAALTEVIGKIKM